MNSVVSQLNSILLFLCLSPVCLALPSDLSGTWTMPCDRGLRKEQVIQDNIATTTEFFHQDKDCTQESFRFKTVGRLAFNANEPFWIDFTYSAVELTVFVPQVVSDFNMRSVCGFQDWQAGTAKVITGLKCALFNVNKPTQIPTVTDLKFGIYKIEEGHLYYGQLTQEKNGSSAEKRPDMFAPDYFVK
ncbi:MAG: hypothetical protein H7256_08210 [Bdellovibrio sp.]|nr:hypothetical protein [Bdellovibrio sp.]